MSNGEGLNKQLFHMDLSGGMDERQRAELMASNVSITRMENLVQNQAGAWVKKPGTIALGSLDNEGSPITFPKTVFRCMDSGLGLINASGRLYHYQESLDSWKRKGILSEFGVTGRFLASTQSVAADHEKILWYASNLSYDVVLYQGGPNSVGTASIILAVYDRDSELEVQKYDLSAQFDATFARAGFVNNRYLHVWMTSGSFTKLIQIDTLNLEWPDDLSGYSPTSHAPGTISDMVTSDTYSYVGIIDLGGSVGRIYQNDTAGNFTDSGDLDAYVNSLDLDNTGLLWAVGLDVGTSALRLYAVHADDVSNISGTFVSATVTSPSNLYLAAYASGKTGIIDFHSDTFGSGTIDTIDYYETSGPSATDVTLKGTIHGWIPVSTPFQFTVETDKIYIQLAKQDPNSTLSSNVVACLSDRTDTTWTDDPFSTTSLRLAANVELNNSLNTYATPVRPRFWNDNQNRSHVTVMVSYQIVSRSAAYAAIDLSSPDQRQYGSVKFGDTTAIACGVPSFYDGAQCNELGFVDMPNVNAAESMTSGDPDGSYRYVAVYRHINKFGEVTYSRMYGPVAVSTNAHKVDVTLCPVGVTNKESALTSDQRVVIDLYRTASGGTQYFLCATSQAFGSPQHLVLGATNGFFTVSDGLGDSDLISNPIAYRQPGTPNTAADRYAFNPSRSLCQHKDRIFCIDQYGQAVVFSSFFVEGETAWTNPVLNLRVHGGSGPLTSVASMDGRLFVFKRDGVWVIDGDGPPENGGTGNEFSQPQILATAFGCIEPRSLAVTPIGIMYQSKRGIELLDHSLHVTWIGEKVQGTSADFPVCTGAVVSHDNRRVRFFMLESEPAVITNVPAKTLVFDHTSGCWSVETYIGVDEGPSEQGIQSGCVVDIGSGETTVLVDSFSVKSITADTCTELDEFGASTMETGWIRVSAPQARQRIYDIITLLKKAAGNHKLTLSLAFNYVETYTQSKTWEPDIINSLSIEELILQPAQQDVLAVKFRIQDGVPTDDTLYPIGEARGFELLDVTYNMAPKPGAPKLAAVAKG